MEGSNRLGRNKADIAAVNELIFMRVVGYFSVRPSSPRIHSFINSERGLDIVGVILMGVPTAR